MKITAEQLDRVKKNAKLSESYNGLEPSLRQLLLTSLNLNSNLTDIQIIDFIGNLNSANMLLMAKGEARPKKFEGFGLAVQNYEEASPSNSFDLKNNFDNDELVDLLSRANEVTKLMIENCTLREQKAELKINKLVREGILPEKNKNLFIKLASVDYENTIAVIISKYSAQLELTELIKLSGEQLYMQGKFERIKELDVYTFKLKYKEFFKVAYTGK